jgi:hypothetical protein
MTFEASSFVYSATIYGIILYGTESKMLRKTKKKM